MYTHTLSLSHSLRAVFSSIDKVTVVTSPRISLCFSLGLHTSPLSHLISPYVSLWLLCIACVSLRHPMVTDLFCLTPCLLRSWCRYPRASISPRCIAVSISPRYRGSTVRSPRDTVVRRFDSPWLVGGSISPAWQRSVISTRGIAVSFPPASLSVSLCLEDFLQLKRKQMACLTHNVLHVYWTLYLAQNTPSKQLL